VADGVSGVLVDGHDPARWAHVLGWLALDPIERDRLSRGAVRHAARFSWDATVDALLDVYAAAARSLELHGPAELDAGPPDPDLPMALVP
jgi:D-inositol-3-phosphate glycosyltransferase